MPKSMTSFSISEENKTNLLIVAGNMEVSGGWIINKALKIYLDNKLGVNAKKKAK